MEMALLYEREIPNPDDFYVRDPAAAVVTWQGRDALRLSGEGPSLVIVPDVLLPHGKIEVDIGAEGTAFPGIAFRICDTQNYELAYPQPHTSGKWDALQYDPVFHGSNTWQLYHGEGAQKTAHVPIGTWFRLRLEFQNQQATFQVGDQPPLRIGALAHGIRTGRAGLWTYKPAFFSNLRIWDDQPVFSSRSFPAMPEKPFPGTVPEWFLEGFGVVSCEPGGILNLNRYLPVSVDTVRLVRRMEMLENGSLTFHVGFSDELSLQLDDQVIFTGLNIWKDTPDWSDRGYVSMDHAVSHTLSRGSHTVIATLKAKELFGFGMALRIEGGPYRLRPAQLYG